MSSIFCYSAEFISVCISFPGLQNKGFLCDRTRVSAGFTLGLFLRDRALPHVSFGAYAGSWVCQFKDELKSSWCTVQMQKQHKRAVLSHPALRVLLKTDPQGHF